MASVRTCCGYAASMIEVSIAPPCTPWRISASVNRPSGWPKRCQLVVTASRPCWARRSCATSDIAALLPPWLVTITSLRMPAATTPDPSSIHDFNATLVDSVTVPGKSVCSVERPTGWIGMKVAGMVSGSRVRTRARKASAISVSVSSGKCGPCCSVAASGSTAIQCAVPPFGISAQRMDAQSCGGFCGEAAVSGISLQDFSLQGFAG